MHGKYLRVRASPIPPWSAAFARGFVMTVPAGVRNGVLFRRSVLRCRCTSAGLFVGSERRRLEPRSASGRGVAPAARLCLLLPRARLRLNLAARLRCTEAPAQALHEIHHLRVVRLV